MRILPLDLNGSKKRIRPLQSEKHENPVIPDRKTQNPSTENTEPEKPAEQKIYLKALSGLSIGSAFLGVRLWVDFTQPARHRR
jgi:hypothetical protein